MDTDGTVWRHSKDIVQPSFQREQISDLASFDIHVTRLLCLIPKDVSTVDLQPLFIRLILDSTTEYLVGESAECLTPKPNKAAILFLDAFQYGQATIGRETQLPYWTASTPDKKFQQAAKIVREFVDRYVDRAVLRCASPNPEKRRKCVLADELVQQTQDREDIRHQLLNTILAAHDTTAVLMANVVFNLARNPDVYANLRRELLANDLETTSLDEVNSL